MKHDELFKICVMLGALGLVLMYASSLYIDVQEAELGEIDETWTGRNVEVTGNVSSFNTYEDILFIDLKDATGNITVVEFNSRSSVDEGDAVIVEGHVDMYKGELEIIARNIQDLD